MTKLLNTALNKKPLSLLRLREISRKQFTTINFTRKELLELDNILHWYGFQPRLPKPLQDRVLSLIEKFRSETL